MSSIGHMFKLFAYDMGPLGPVLLLLLALGSNVAWLQVLAAVGWPAFNSATAAYVPRGLS